MRDDETSKLARLHELVNAITDLSVKIDDMKKEREMLVDEFKRIQTAGEDFKEIKQYP